MRKKTLELKIRQPAIVRLANTSVAFQGGSSNPEYAPIVQSLLITLGTELVSNEKTLVEKEKPADAAWVLKMVVTGAAISPPAHRTETSGTTTTSYVRWNGSLNVAYQILDHSGRVYDARNVAADYNKEFSSSGLSTNRWGIPSFPSKKSSSSQKQPATVEDVKQILINDVVVQIASQLGNTTKPLEVQIATGDTHLDRAADFLTQSLWTRALDELEKNPAFPKPDQEAYRQYDLGLAYEAISYSSSNSNDAKENIYKAAEYYDKALEMYPKEKYFVATVARTRDALARYKDLEQMEAKDKAVKKSELLEAKTPEVKMPEAKVEPPKADIKPKAVTASDVIDLYNSQVPEEQIIDMIQSSSSVDFNPHDKDTMIAVAKAKLTIRIQNALRAKVGAPLLSPPPSRRSPVAKAQ